MVSLLEDDENGTAARAPAFLDQAQSIAVHPEKLESAAL
jgi:hypothetical protein